MDMTQSGLDPTPEERKQVNVIFQLDDPWRRKAKIDSFGKGSHFEIG
jgi:hypothetical protein